MKVLILSCLVVSCWTLPTGVHYAQPIQAQPVAVVSQVAPSSQYHAQDEYGQYSYGYASSDGQAKAEVKGVDGSIAGKYSYIDANGKKIEVSYVADKDGFRATGDHIPSGVPELPEFLAKAYKEANSRLVEAYSYNGNNNEEGGEEENGGKDGKYEGKGNEEENSKKEEEEEEDEEEEEHEGGSEEEESGDEEKKGKAKESPTSTAPAYSPPKPAPASKPQVQQPQAFIGFAHLGHYALVQPVSYVQTPPTGYYYRNPVTAAPVTQPPIPVIKPSPPKTVVTVTKSTPSQTYSTYVSVPNYHSQPQIQARVQTQSVYQPVMPQVTYYVGRR